MTEYYAGLSLLMVLFFATPIIVGVCLLVFVQTWTVARKLDRYFFNTKYFTAQEMNWFDHAPWSWMKTAGYIGFITFPRLMKKRLGEETVLDKINWFDHLLARTTIILLIIGCVLLLNMAVAGVIHLYLMPLFR